MAWVPKLEFTVQGTGEQIEFPVERAFNGGYAGRDQASVQKHIDELAVIGVPAPAQIPTLFALGNNLVTTADSVQVQHDKTSGEVEYVLLIGADETYVTVGSDQTDRDLESKVVEWSKQSYPNMFAPEVWRYSEVKDHWDDLILRCWVTKDGRRSLYQEATLAELLPPGAWLNILEKLFGRVPKNIAVMSGTVSAKEGLVYGDEWDLEFHDPVLNRTIRHSYSVEILKEKIV